MGIASSDQVVTDSEVFLQLSARQRVITVLRLSGRTAQQVESLMARNAVIGTMVDNIITFRDPSLQDKCACHRERLEDALDLEWPQMGQAHWSNAETLDLIVAVAKEAALPPLLQKAFDRLAIGHPA